MYSRYKKGFALIELLLVVAILSVLIAIVTPRLVGRSERAKMTAASVEINNIATALDLYELDNGKYPPAEDGLNALRSKPAGASNWNGPYLKKMPSDPWGNAYSYKSPGMHNSEDYDLYSFGPDGAEGGGDDITNWQEEDANEEQF